MENMEQEMKRLQGVGYTFDIEEKPIKTNPSPSQPHYYQVLVSMNGQTIGTRSELKKERALERAIQFAQDHETGDASREHGWRAKRW